MISYEEYCALYEELERKAMELLRELHDADPIDGFEWLRLDSIDTQDVYLTGVKKSTKLYSTWEDIDFDIPTKALFDPQIWQDEVNNRALLKAKREADKIKLAEEAEIKKAESRRQQYEKLKKEFES